jgi:hypothetical protein
LGQLVAQRTMRGRACPQKGVEQEHVDHHNPFPRG